MEAQRVVIYSSHEEPRLIRPPKSGEDHIWHRPDGKSFKLEDGKWNEWAANDLNTEG